MCSARLSSTALSTRGSQDAVAVAFPDFTGERSSLSAFWASDRVSADPGLEGDMALELVVLCLHGHLISRFQIDSLAGSLAGLGEAVLCVTGVPPVLSGKREDAIQAPRGAFVSGLFSRNDVACASR